MQFGVTEIAFYKLLKDSRWICNLRSDFGFKTFSTTYLEGRCREWMRSRRQPSCSLWAEWLPSDWLCRFL